MTKFQEFMNRYQLSQYRLHKLSGFSKSQVSEWQRGLHRPSLKSARRLAVCLQLSIQTVKSQIELRENYQNDIDDAGAFVARRSKNRLTPLRTNDPTRTASACCETCRRLWHTAAPVLEKAA